MSDPFEAAAIVAFGTTAAVIIYLASRERRSAEAALSGITGRQQAAQALQRQANLLEQAHDAIFVWEFPRTIVYWNRGAERLYGFSRDEARGRLSHELLHTEHPLATSDFEAVLERDGEWTGELTHTTRDGRTIIVESRHVLMRAADGRRLVRETNRDISASAPSRRSRTWPGG